jgi:hypothetical protein
VRGEEDERVHELGSREGECERDRAAHRRAQDGGCAETQLLDQRRGVGGEILDREWLVSAGRLAHPAVVHEDELETAAEGVEEVRIPGGAVPAKPFRRSSGGPEPPRS